MWPQKSVIHRFSSQWIRNLSIANWRQSEYCLCVGTLLSMLTQGICNTTFTFIFCLCRAWKSDRGESLGYSLKIKSFLSMCIVLGICMAFLIPCFTQELLKAHILWHISFLKLFLPRPPDLSCLSCLLSQAAEASTCAFKCFYQMLPGKLPQTWEWSELGETKASPEHQSFRKPPDRSKYTTTILWEQGLYCPLRSLAPGVKAWNVGKDRLTIKTPKNSLAAMHQLLH